MRALLSIPLLVACSSEPKPAPPADDKAQAEDRHLKEVDAAMTAFAAKVKSVIAMPTEPCKSQSQVGEMRTRPIFTLDGVQALAVGKPMPPSGKLTNAIPISAVAAYREGKPLTKNAATTLVEQLGKLRKWMVFDVASYDPAAGKLEARVVHLDLKAGTPTCSLSLKVAKKVDPISQFPTVVRDELESLIYALPP